MFLSNFLSHLFCCRFLNHTGRHHTFHEAKQLWQQRSVRNFKFYLRNDDLNEGFLRGHLIYLVVAGYLLRMEPSGHLLALLSPLLRYVLKISGINRLETKTESFKSISVYCWFNVMKCLQFFSFFFLLDVSFISLWSLFYLLRQQLTTSTMPATTKSTIFRSFSINKKYLNRSIYHAELS